VLSAKILVRSTHAGFAEALRWHLARFVDGSPSGSSSYQLDLYVRPEEENEDPVPYSLFLDTLFRGQAEETFLGDVLGLALWEHWQAFTVAVRDYLLLHAGAVVIGGGAVLLPAPPDAGKTSLTLALLQGGSGYLSDEFGAIDPVSARAYPVARPLALDQEALRWFPGLEERLVDKAIPVRMSKRFLRPEDVGGTIVGPAPIRAVVVPDPDFDGEARLETITRAAALEELAALAFNLSVYADRGVVLLARALADAETFRVVGGDPVSRARAIRARLA
jgi:hypothetical protein